MKKMWNDEEPAANVVLSNNFDPTHNHLGINLTNLMKTQNQDMIAMKSFLPSLKERSCSYSYAFCNVNQNYSYV